MSNYMYYAAGLVLLINISLLIFIFIKLKRTRYALVQMIIANNDLNNQLEYINSDEQKTHNENFIKFLSDSRDWAFTYIEDVQSGLKKFIDEINPEIEYYNKYGVIVEGMVGPHDKAFKKISKEFEELKKLLPLEKE